MKKICRIVALVCIVAFFPSSFGCAWAGRTAGKAQAKMEKGVDALEQGYKEGYSSETNKSEDGKSE